MMRISFQFGVAADMCLENPSEEAEEAYFEIQDDLASMEVLIDAIIENLTFLEEEARLESIINLCHTGV